MPTLRQATERPSNLAEMVQSLQPAHSSPFPSDPGSAIPDYSPLSLAPPPSILSTGSDQLKQFYRRGVSQYRIPPLPTKANPSVNASIQSISKIVAQQVVASTPVASSSSGVTSVGLTMPSIFVAPVSGSPITSSGTLAVQFAPEAINTVFAGPSGLQGNAPLDSASFAQGTGFSVTPTTGTSAANDFALLAISAPTVGTVSAQPDASWTSLANIPNTTGGGLFWKKVPVAGTISGTATFSNSGACAVAGILALRTASTPATRNFTSTGWGGGTTSIATPSNTFAGSTIFVVIQGPQGLLTPGQVPWVVTDSQGNTYTQLTSAFTTANNGAQVTTFVATGTAAAALTATVSTTFRNGAGTTGNTLIYIVEVTNIAPSVFTPSFRPLVAADIPSLDASIITTGLLALARGGTNADLSATGGASRFLRQNSSGAAITVIQPDFADLSGIGKATKYNNIALVSNGIPAEYATVDNITATANIAATTIYSVPASGAGLYRLSYYVIVNRAATTSSTLPDLQLTWTDQDNSTLQTFGPVDSATPSANTLTTTYSGSVVISAKASTNIQYQTGVTTAYASVGGTSMQYSVRLKVEAL
jgi:hypothetical protein